MEDINKPPLLVRDLMSVGVATCSPDTPVAQVANMLLEKGLEMLVVLESGEGHALGVIGREQLVSAFSSNDPRQLTAVDLMVDGVPQVPPDIPITAAVQIMLDRGVRSLFLMHHSAGIEYPAAYISYHHILRYLGAYQDGQLKTEMLADLGIKAQRKSPLDTFMERRELARQRNQK